MPVEVEVAQRAVEVVRAADGAPGLHAGEALHRLAGEGAHHRLVGVEQRLHQHLGDLFGRERVHRARRAAVLARLLLLHLAPHLVERALVALDEPVLGPAQREVDLEHRLERPPVGVVLDQRRAERVLERLAILDRDVLHRLHRVEVLGERHRQPGIAQLGDEPVEQIEHRLGRSDGS